MWWLAYVGLCIFGALVVTDQRSRACFVYCAIGLVVMQAPKVLPIGDFQWLFSASIWCGVSVATWRHLVSFSVLTLVSATCYLWGRLGGYEFAPTSAPLFWADMAGLAALASIGTPYVTRLLSDTFGGGSLGRDLR